MVPVEEKPNVSIEQLDLPPRVYRCLKTAGLHTVESILHTSPVDLLKIRNMGSRSIKVLKRVLRKKGYSWNSDMVRAQKEEDLAAILGMDVEQVGFSDSLVECLHLAQIDQVGELAAKKPSVLLRYPQIGHRRLKIIRQVLNDLGLDLGMDLVRLDSGHQWMDLFDYARLRLAENLQTPADIYFFSKEYDISQKTLQRFLRKEPLTQFLISKLRKIFSEKVALEHPFDRTTLKSYQRFMDVESVYRQVSGLKKAASRLQMSHEHVRKILQMGASLGLFSYLPRP